MPSPSPPPSARSSYFDHTQAGEQTLCAAYASLFASAALAAAAHSYAELPEGWGIATPHDTTIIVARDATDCLAPADACRWAQSHDMPMDYSLISALETALQLGTVLCYIPGTVNLDKREPLDLMAVREEWGMRDTSEKYHPVAKP